MPAATSAWQFSSYWRPLLNCLFALGLKAGWGVLEIGLLRLCAVAGCCSGFAGGFCVGCLLAKGKGGAPMDCVAGGSCFGGYVALMGLFCLCIMAGRILVRFGRLNAPAESRLSNWEDTARLEYVFGSPFVGAADWSRQWNLRRQICARFWGFFLALAFSLSGTHGRFYRCLGHSQKVHSTRRERLRQDWNGSEKDYFYGQIIFGKSPEIIKGL